MELEVLENFNYYIYIRQLKTKSRHYLSQEFLLSLNSISQTKVENTGTLKHYNFTVQEALDFCAMSGGLISHVVTGSEQFPGHFIRPFREITLSAKIIGFLVQYYSNIYTNYNFYNENQTPKSKQSILVSSTACQATALKLEDEIYSSFFSCSDLNSNILARWQLNDSKRINWPGIIKFFFEHRISLPNSTTSTSHYLAIDILSTNADGSYHAELWKNRFIEQGMKNILPIQRIIGRFVKTDGFKLSGNKKKFDSIEALTQIVNEVKSILTSSDVRNQLETTKNFIESLKHRLDIYKQNQSEFITSMQWINNEHRIKIQCIEDTLITTTTMLENFSTSTSAVQTTVNNILSHIQNRNNNINILNTINNSPHVISTANPILTAKIHDKMCYFNGFEDLEDSESQTLNKKYIYDFELGTKNQKNKRITQNYVELFIKEFDTQFEETSVLNKIPENQLNHPKSEVEKLFSFEAMSPEKLLVPVLPWMSDKGNCIQKLADEVIKRTRLEKLNSRGRHSYTTPILHKIVEIADLRWAEMRSIISAKPNDLPIWAWDQADSNEYYKQFDDSYEK
ncbi:5215_t:CDS:2 [Cetraspora pellucida]|uniref:5215_t:CDS:1 n=1 Tax=Cetraspora pellucida TaxID=1433469 RepID=A0A9N8W9P5_9GLOM|nr:5215_t:CDS:2 [Cetraspora pellucida]